MVYPIATLKPFEACWVLF